MTSDDTDYEAGSGSDGDMLSEQEKYMVQLSAANDTKMEYCDKIDLNKRRQPASRPANAPVRVKRVVSCKRKTRRLTISSGVRRKPSITAKTLDGFSKDTSQEYEWKKLDGGWCESQKFIPTLGVFQVGGVEETSEPYCHYFTEIQKDHSQMTQVLFRRNLRLNIALTLWKRNAGELISFLLRFQDISLLVDCLPVLTQSLLQDSCAHVTAGFCVDLFPLVKKVLRCHYEDYLIRALLWIQAILTKWQLLLRDGGQPDDYSCDYKNMHAIKQQLQGLYREYQHIHFATKVTGEIWKAIESQLHQTQP